MKPAQKPSILRRIFTRASNIYEAALPSRRRGYVASYVRDARFDANSYTRWEMCRKIRDFQENCWLIRRLRSLEAQYTVGMNGLVATPASSDHDWNQAAWEAYSEWCERPALDSVLPLSLLSVQMANCRHIDGEFFVNFTSEKRGDKQSRPAIQLVESHRIGSQYQTIDINQPANLVDGVRVDAMGRPVAYLMRQNSFDVIGVGNGKYDEMPIFNAEFPERGGMLHVYMPDRIGMYRGITPYYATVNQIQDLIELSSLEMDRAKQNALVAYFLKTVDGELPDASELVGADLNGAGESGISSEPDKATLERLTQYKTALGASVQSLRVGEDVQQMGSDSPSAATQWYWKFLTEQICESVNTPVILVLPESYQGATTRAVLDDAAIHFRSLHAIEARVARACYRFFMSWAIRNDSRLLKAPADWAHCHVTPPRSPNVDVGRNSSAMLAELAAGVTNLTDIAGPQGKTARELILKRARDIVEIKRICAEITTETGIEVTPEEVSKDLLAASTAIAGAGAGADDDEPPAKPAPPAGQKPAKKRKEEV